MISLLELKKQTLNPLIPFLQEQIDSGKNVWKEMLAYIKNDEKILSKQAVLKAAQKIIDYKLKLEAEALKAIQNQNEKTMENQNKNDEQASCGSTTEKAEQSLGYKKIFYEKNPGFALNNNEEPLSDKPSHFPRYFQSDFISLSPPETSLNEISSSSVKDSPKNSKPQKIKKSPPKVFMKLPVTKRGEPQKKRKLEKTITKQEKPKSPEKISEKFSSLPGEEIKKVSDVEEVKIIKNKFPPLKARKQSIFSETPVIKRIKILEIKKTKLLARIQERLEVQDQPKLAPKQKTGRNKELDNLHELTNEYYDKEDIERSGGPRKCTQISKSYAEMDEEVASNRHEVFQEVEKPPKIPFKIPKLTAPRKVIEVQDFSYNGFFSCKLCRETWKSEVDFLNHVKELHSLTLWSKTCVSCSGAVVSSGKTQIDQFNHLVKHIQELRSSGNSET